MTWILEEHVSHNACESGADFNKVLAMIANADMIVKWDEFLYLIPLTVSRPTWSSQTVSFALNFCEILLVGAIAIGAHVQLR